MAHQQESLELRVSQTFLAHAILAHTSPEVTTLDQIISLQSRRALRIDAASDSKSLADIPPELLLIVRSYLIPAVTDALINETMLAYTDSLLSRARRLCGECLKYNVQVFGPDALTWPCSRPGLTDDAQGCECGTWALRGDLCVAEGSEWTKMDVSALKDTIEHFERKAISKRGHKRSHSYSTASVAWLEEYLAKRAARGKPMRDVIHEVLASDFSCDLDGDATRSKQPSSSNADVPDTVMIIPSPSCLPPSAEDRLKIVARELALSTNANTNAGSELLTTARDMAASVIAATVAGAPDTTAVKASSPQGVSASVPSLFTLVGAGIALGAYAFARLAVL